MDHQHISLPYNLSTCMAAITHISGRWHLSALPTQMLGHTWCWRSADVADSKTGMSDMCLYKSACIGMRVLGSEGGMHTADACVIGIFTCCPHTVTCM